MHTEQPAVERADRLAREIEAWRSAMPGDGFTQKQIKKRVSSGTYLVGALGAACYASPGC